MGMDNGLSSDMGLRFIIQAAKSVCWAACLAAIITDICLQQSTGKMKGEQIAKVLLQKEYSFLMYYETTKLRLQVRIIYYKNSAVNS